MKTLLNKAKIGSLTVLGSIAAMVISCSDITETQQPFLDRGETIYVGKLDSVVVRGGDNRVVIEGRNTFLRTAKQCIVKWIDINGNASEKLFELADAIDGDYTRLEVSPLTEGDYQFFVQTIDASGNKSLAVECFGSSYGKNYKDMQPKIIVTGISMDDNGVTEMTLSKSTYASGFDIEYINTNDVKVTKSYDEAVNKIEIPDWKELDGTKISITTRVLPLDKLGLDVISLDPNVQTVNLLFSTYNVDKTKITPMALTAHDDDGKSFGAVGISGLFDNQFGGGGAGVEAWGNGQSAPGHFCFDLGKKSIISAADIIGRDGYPGWDIVKFEIWGRESIEDGPDGETGYKILSKSKDAGFEDEAVKRGWAKVGNGWCKYEKPRKNPQRAKVALTEVDHSFKPRYIMFRVRSVLTPNIAPVPNDQYYGDDGGYFIGDGVNNGDRAFCIAEMGLEAQGITYRLQ